MGDSFHGVLYSIFEVLQNRLQPLCARSISHWKVHSSLQSPNDKMSFIGSISEPNYNPIGIGSAWTVVIGIPICLQHILDLLDVKSLLLLAPLDDVKRK